MVKWADLGTGAKAGVIGSAGVVVAGVVMLVLRAEPEAPATAPVLTPGQVAEATAEPRPAPEAELSADQAEAEPLDQPEDPAPEALDTAEQADFPEAEAETEAEVVQEPVPDAQSAESGLAALVLPQVETFSLSQDGMAVIAGRGEAEARLALMLDAQELAVLSLDGAGRFATILTLPPHDQPRSLSLVQTGADGQPRPSEVTIIVAPFSLPVDTVAEGATDAPDPAQVEEAAPVLAETFATETSAPETSPPVAAAPEAPSNLIVAQDEVRVLRAPDPALPLSIDTIAYDDGNGVIIAGQGPALGSVRLYLDNALKIDTLSDERGAWRATLADVDAGLYTLRADALDGAGKVVARAETPFVREAPEQLAALLGTPAAAEPEPAGPTPESLPAPEATPEPEAAPEAAPRAPQAPEAVQPGPGDNLPTTPDQAPASLAEAPATEPAPEPAAQPAAPPVTATIVTVQPGFTLWGIAREAYGEGVQYIKVFEANRSQIRNPDLIYPGQVFTLPAP